MSHPSPFCSALSAVRSRYPFLILVLCITPLIGVKGQEHDDDHEHDHLHFSHPLVTESPSPDTKLRLDYLGIRTNAAVDIRENIFRIEGEYAFNPSVSVALVAPFVSRTSASSDRVSGIANIELSLKAASLAFGEHGLLLGGGVSAELPTGDDAKEIGSTHIVEIEPFLDVGYKRDKVELVGFATLSSTFHRRAGEEAERNLSFDFSALYQIRSRLEGLLEIATERALIGPESGSQQTFIAPGLKVYPFTNRQLMFGASIEFGTGAIRDTRALLLSAFYHF
jgi:hypothetical protein